MTVKLSSHPPHTTSRIIVLAYFAARTDPIHSEHMTVDKLPFETTAQLQTCLNWATMEVAQ